MLRVDLFVTSLFYCHHCWDSYADSWCLWVWIQDLLCTQYFQNCSYCCWISKCRISGLQSPMLTSDIKHIIKDLDSE